jgi:hypothetical protein
MILFAVSPVYARHLNLSPRARVAVCLDGVLKPEYANVTSTASEIFAGIGVWLEWHENRHCPPEAVKITLSTSKTGAPHSDVLAYSAPFEGTHIVVYLDRVEATVDSRRAPVLLAHVFAHEITHILQGCNYHSDSGLMKAHWDYDDYRDMAWRPLQFTPYDIDLIRDGMARRADLRVAAR